MRDLLTSASSVGSATFQGRLNSILNIKSTPKLTVTHPRSTAILRSCLDAIAVGTVPASVAVLINEKVLQAEEDKVSIEGTGEGHGIQEILWVNCGILEIVATADTEMHRLEHPNGCADRATCRADRDTRVKKALAMAYEALKSEVQAMVWQDEKLTEL
jgi:hypothetical protein